MGVKLKRTTALVNSWEINTFGDLMFSPDHERIYIFRTCWHIFPVLASTPEFHKEIHSDSKQRASHTLTLSTANGSQTLLIPVLDDVSPPSPQVAWFAERSSPLSQTTTSTPSSPSRHRRPASTEVSCSSTPLNSPWHFTITLTWKLARGNVLWWNIQMWCKMQVLVISESASLNLHHINTQYSRNHNPLIQLDPEEKQLCVWVK